jgi:hypothetical protein
LNSSKKVKLNKTNNMSFWNKVKNSGRKTKLRGDIALIEREVNGRKKTFGVELYDLLTNDKNKLLGMTAGTIFKGQEAELKEPFGRARDDVVGVQARKDIKQKDLDVLEVRGAHTLPDTTMGQKANKAGRAMSNAGTGTKLRAEMALLDREMKIRKEQFGIEVFNVLKPSEQKDKGLRATITTKLANMSPQEKDIQACIDKAKTAVGSLEGRIKSKQTEMGVLDSELEPLAIASMN